MLLDNGQADNGLFLQASAVVVQALKSVMLPYRTDSRHSQRWDLAEETSLFNHVATIPAR